MRKVTKKIANAFHNEEKLKISNTYTDGQAVWLHGNKIIERRQDGIWFTLAGWDTLTTRERLNGILPVHITRINGKSYLFNGHYYLNNRENGKCLRSDEWINLNEFNQGG